MILTLHSTLSFHFKYSNYFPICFHVQAVNRMAMPVHRKETTVKNKFEALKAIIPYNKYISLMFSDYALRPFAWINVRKQNNGTNNKEEHKRRRRSREIWFFCVIVKIYYFGLKLCSFTRFCYAASFHLVLAVSVCHFSTLLFRFD